MEPKSLSHSSGDSLGGSQGLLQEDSDKSMERVEGTEWIALSDCANEAQVSEREGTPVLTLTDSDDHTEELAESLRRAKNTLKKMEEEETRSGRSTPPVFFEDGEVEVFDLPPQFMVCRRNSATVINIPRPRSIGLPPQATMEEVQEEDDEEDDEEREEDIARRISSSSRPTLQRADPVREEEHFHDASQEIFKVPREVIFSRMSSGPLQKQKSLLQEMDPRLSRSLEDLQKTERGGRFRILHSTGRRTSSPGVHPHRHRVGASLLPLKQQSLDVHFLRRQQAIGEGPWEPLHEVPGKRRTMATFLHRGTSGITFPFQYSLDVSHEENEEDIEEEDEIEDDEISSSESRQRRSSVATAFHRNATGATICLPAQYSMDLLDNDMIDDAPESAEEDLTGADVAKEPSDEVDGEPHTEVRSRRSSTTVFQRKGSIAIPLFRDLDDSFSESYFAVKGAALILPQSECPRTVTRGTHHGGDIQTHLQSMFYLLRPHDTIKVAVKLESMVAMRNRYMAVVSTTGRQDTEESIIVGIDISEKATIGLVLPIWGDTSITLDGDGGFKVTSFERHHIFKPVSVQAMWSALQSLIKGRDIAHQHRYYPKGLTHTWVTYYDANISSDQLAINEWNTMEDIESHRPDLTLKESLAKVELEQLIKVKLKEIMLTVDLEEVTSKYLRTRLEDQMDICLKHMRQFIDEEMIVILRQMDSASEIFPFLYLGSEWNASNLEELKENGVGHILNVTREIDNFFPGMFDYSNIRVYDIEQAELLKHWDNTFKFITKAKNRKSKVLVHCKMGISRSASTVIAYAMKEFGWNLEEAFNHVKEKRSCIRPNSGFMQQLITYEGILDASKQRNNKLWRSRSEGNLENSGSPQSSRAEEESATLCALGYAGFPTFDTSRPRSWSPEDSTTELLMKTHDLASEGDSSDDEIHTNYTEVNGEFTETIACNFLPWDDDLEDFMESSRSADSLEDILCGDVSRKRSHPDDTEPGDSIVLLSYRALSESKSDLSEVGATPELMMDESDPEDPVAQEPCGKVARGFYDVQMLDSNLLGQEVPIQDYYDHENTTHSNKINYYLHPDVKMELLIAQQRKHRRIAQLLKLSQPQNFEPEIEVQEDTEVKCQPVPPSTPGISKLRADNSWIKDIQSSPQDPTKDTDQDDDQESELETSPSESPPCDTQELISETVPEPSNSATLCEPEQARVPEEAPLGNDDSLDSSKESSPSSGESSREVSVMHHYEKEAIPWNPGTVKRHKRHLEDRIKSETTKKEDQGSRLSGSSSSESGSTDDLESEDELQFKAPSQPCDIPAGQGMLLISGAEVGESSTDDQPPEYASVTDTNAPSLPQGGATEPEDAGGGVKPSSIYEMEDIAVEPGVVQRTLQEIENRESERSPPPEIEEKTVHRSASMKEDSPSKRDRTSERRRTCTPVLRTQEQTQSKQLKTFPPGDSTMGSSEDVSVLQEVVKGRVKQHKQAIESRKSKSECETEAEPLRQETEVQLASPSDEVSIKLRSQSLPLNTNIEIPSGSVWKQKKELELRLGQPTTGPSHGMGEVNTKRTPSSSIPMVMPTPKGSIGGKAEPVAAKPPLKMSLSSPGIPGSRSTPSAISSSDQKVSREDPEGPLCKPKPVCSEGVGAMLSLHSGNNNGQSDDMTAETATPTVAEAVRTLSISSKSASESKPDSKPTLPQPGVTRQPSWKASKPNVFNPNPESTVDCNKTKPTEGSSSKADESSEPEMGNGKTVTTEDEEKTYVMPAYPEADITWSIGMVRQQKEAIEKISSVSTDGSSMTSSESAAVTKAPSGATSPNDGQIGSASGKVSKVLSVSAVNTEDQSIGAVSRSSSFKENVPGCAKPEVSLSFSSHSKAPLDILTSTENSSDNPSSPVLSSDCKKFTTKKEVLILEAKNSNIACKEINPVAGAMPPIDTSRNLPTDVTEEREKTPEDKKVANLVGIFEQKEQEEKEKEKNIPSPQEYKPEKQVKIITSSDLAAAAAVATQKPQGGTRSHDRKVKGQCDPGQPELKDSSAGVVLRRTVSGSFSHSRAALPSSLPVQKSDLSRNFSLPTQGSQAASNDDEQIDRRASYSDAKTSKIGSPCGQMRPVSVDSKSVFGGGSTVTRTAVNRVPINTLREPDLGEGLRKSRKLHGKSHPLAKLTGTDMGQNPTAAFGRDRTGRSNNPVYNTM